MEQAEEFLLPCFLIIPAKTWKVNEGEAWRRFPGRYFKKQTNETMQQYIFNYKMQMVESRLLHSEMRISEIVEELGFTDESHLNKLFRKYKDCNPTDFRKKHRS